MSDEYPKSLQPIPDNAETVFTGEIFELVQWPQKMFDGSIATFEKARRSASVGIIPITSENKIVITKQEQPAMQPFLSLVGGVVDPGETPLAAAKRELLEEAGLVSDAVTLWYADQPVTKVEWPIYVYIAKNCRKESEQSLDAGEKITLLEVTWDEFLELQYAENFRDKDTALKLLRMQKNPEKLAEFKARLFN